MLLPALVLLQGWLLQPRVLTRPLAALGGAMLPHCSRAPPPAAALDYKDPAVAEEFAACQALDTEEVEDELAASGVVAPPTMNDMDLRMMLVEMRLRKSGKMGGKSEKQAMKKPGPDANPFEIALYEKPAFRELYEEKKMARLQNEINLCIEYVNDPRRAKERYGGTAKYDELVADIEAALNAKVEKTVTSGKLSYAGFPANMGEAGVRMTLAGFGELSDFSWEASDDGITCFGTAEYEDPDAAKAAIDKYDGMDMGLGTAIEFTPA